VAKAALAVNIVVRPLSGYFLRPGEGMSGLLIGYGCVAEEEIEPAFEKLAAVLDPALEGRGETALAFRGRI